MTSGASNRFASDARFPATRWSVVLAARERSDAALEEICRLYWKPLYAYARHRGFAPHDAQDLTQEFFRLLVQKHWLDSVEKERGRLRTFLLTAMKRFIMNEWRRAATQKRGGGKACCALDTALAESMCAADKAQLAPEDVFDREWAMTLLKLTTSRLEEEFASAGKAETFEELKSCLTTSHAAMDYESIGRRCGLSEGAARVAVHRLRKRFREAYREEIRQTLPPGADLDEEMRHLAAALGK